MPQTHLHIRLSPESVLSRASIDGNSLELAVQQSSDTFGLDPVRKRNDDFHFLNLKMVKFYFEKPLFQTLFTFSISFFLLLVLSIFLPSARTPKDTSKPR